MKKALIALMTFFIVVSVGAGIYAAVDEKKEAETKVASMEDAMYPEGLRPNAVTEEEDEPTIEEETKVEELAPDENFTEFEIEEEPSPEPSTEPSPEESLEEQAKPEASAEPEVSEEAVETPEEEIISEEPAIEGDVGSEIEITEGKVNVRDYPSSRESKILGVALRGERGTLVEKGKDYSIIKIGDLEGYIYNKCWKFP